VSIPIIADYLLLVLSMNIEKLRASLSANIKKRRKILGLSQEKLAETAGISSNMMNDIEGCRTWVSDKTMVKLAKALKVEVYQLFVPPPDAAKNTPFFSAEDILDELEQILHKHRPSNSEKKCRAPVCQETFNL
jgi:transcriptional regulator with XRE-family HTH domain